MAEIKRENGRMIIDYMARDYDSLLQSMRELIPYKLPKWEDYESEADFGNVLLQLFAHTGDILSYYQDRVANESFLGTAQTRRSIIHHLRLIGYELATAAPASTNLTITVPATHTETTTISKGDAFATKSQKDKSSVRFEYTREVPLTIDWDTVPIGLQLLFSVGLGFQGDLELGTLSAEFRQTFSDNEISLPPNSDIIITMESPGIKWHIENGGQTYTVIRESGVLNVYGSDGKKHYLDIPVEEGRLIGDEILGVSDGNPNQRFTLAHPRLILRSLGASQTVNKDITLITELGGMIEEWTLQESLAFSREGQKDFVLETDEQDQTTVIFGDGAFGAIPLNETVIKVTYRVGGGTHGNVAAHTIQTIVDAPQLTLLGAEVTNPKAATGGAERESIERAVSNAPKVFRSLKRAVTKEDCEALALDFKGVGKVRAQATNWNTVTLYVAPEGGGHVSDVLEANLLAYFEDKRPISTTIEIEDVDYVKIYVTAEVGMENYYAEEDIEVRVQETAGSLLAFDNVDFGQSIYLSKFYEAIEAIEGVAYVNIREFRPESEAAGYLEKLGKIKLTDNEIPIVPNHPVDDAEYIAGIKVVFEGDD